LPEGGVTARIRDARSDRHVTVVTSMSPQMNDRSRFGLAARPFAAALCLGAAALAATGDAASQPAQPRRTADAAVVSALWAHHWTLQSATDPAGAPNAVLLPPGHPIVMSFKEGNVSIRSACNQMNGRWRLSPLGPLSIGQLAATMRSCEPPLMEADAQLSAALARPLGVDLTRGATPILRLTTESQQTLTFIGQPTPRSLYGAPKRLFLEVGPQLVECKLPSGAAGSCLQVREVRFDKQGLRSGTPGPWRPLAESIEGYAHTPGVRNVLRVDRYQRKAAAGESAAVYVLDLVVESQTVAGK